MNGHSDEMIIWWSDEDAAYVVEVPELSGCMAHGKTRPDAIRQAEAAIRLWIKTVKEDGLEVPQPHRANRAAGEGDGTAARQSSDGVK